MKVAFTSQTWLTPQTQPVKENPTDSRRCRLRCSPPAGWSDTVRWVHRVRWPDHFPNAGEMTDYVAGKGVPAPRVDVISLGTVLVLGGLGLLGVYPVLAASTIGTFFHRRDAADIRFLGCSRGSKTGRTNKISEKYRAIGGGTAVPRSGRSGVGLRARSRTLAVAYCKQHLQIAVSAPPGGPSDNSTASG